jgi:hypothetical protein
MAIGAYERSRLDAYRATLITPPYNDRQKSQSIYLYAQKYLNPLTKADVDSYLSQHGLPVIP